MKGYPPPAKLLLYATPEHECSYLPGNGATTLFVDPDFPKDLGVYTLLSRNGFRRSGEHVYRPDCRTCKACVPVRLPVKESRPRRAQRRAWRTNEDICVTAKPARFEQEHFTLYRRYLRARHPGGGMDETSPKQYREFLLSTWADTLLYEFKLGDRLMAVCVTDRLVDGLSAVYTFFDPEFPWRSLGTHCVLWQIAETRRLGLEWLYLGYWIADSGKMTYKENFRPQERFIDGAWRRWD